MNFIADANVGLRQ